MSTPIAARRRSHVSPEAPVISLDQPGRLLTRHVLALSGWSHSTLYLRISASRFPAPEKDGRLNYWLTSTVKKALGLGEELGGMGASLKTSTMKVPFNGSHAAAKNSLDESVANADQERMK